MNTRNITIPSLRDIITDVQWPGEDIEPGVSSHMYVLGLGAERWEEHTICKLINDELV